MTQVNNMVEYTNASPTDNRVMNHSLFIEEQHHEHK